MEWSCYSAQVVVRVSTIPVCLASACAANCTSALAATTNSRPVMARPAALPHAPSFYPAG
eukprot:3404586-Amphidinium_carterae.1